MIIAKFMYEVRKGEIGPIRIERKEVVVELNAVVPMLWKTNQKGDLLGPTEI